MFCLGCSLLQIMIPALPHLKMPRTVEERREKFQLKDKPVTRQVLLDYMMDLLLLPYRSVAPSTLAELCCNDSIGETAGSWGRAHYYGFFQVDRYYLELNFG